MGYYTRSNGYGGQIRCFTPDNTPTKLYIEAGYSSISLLDLITKAQEHFGMVDWSDLEISSERIHTDCLDYDLYDPSDYTNYIVIEKTPGLEMPKPHIQLRPSPSKAQVAVVH